MAIVATLVPAESTTTLSTFGLSSNVGPADTGDVTVAHGLTLPNMVDGVIPFFVVLTPLNDLGTEFSAAEWSWDQSNTDATNVVFNKAGGGGPAANVIGAKAYVFAPHSIF